MELSKVIIHEIKKESGENESNVILSAELIGNSQTASALISTLLESYNNDKLLYAIFDETEGNYFPQKYNQYRLSERNDEGFILFTQNVLNRLNRNIKQITLAKGGYFIFAEYKLNGIDFVSVFLIRDTEGKILRKTDRSYAIQSIEYLDTKNLAMACRINENKLAASDINYLTFTQLKQQTVSDYFLDWICIQQLESSTEYTKALYDLVNRIQPPTDEDTNEPLTIEDFRDKIYSYITSNPNKVVNLQDLSQHFYNNPNHISDFAQSEDITIDTEFRYNKRQLRKFISVTVNRDGINLKFSRGALNEKVKFSDTNQNIVIIDSERFAEALRQELDMMSDDRNS